MKIPHSTFYYRGGEKSFEELKAEADLKGKIEKICLDWPRYGYRRVTGYHLSRRLDTTFTLETLHLAVRERNPAPGCIHLVGSRGPSMLAVITSKLPIMLSSFSR